MSFDNLCKLLAEKNPETFTQWLVGDVSGEVTVLKTELSIEPIRADALTLLRTIESILHIEFQTEWPSKPPMPLRLLDYWVRLYRLYGLPVIQVIVVLMPPPKGTVIEAFFQVGGTRHEFRVIKMWEQDPEFFLNDPVLLPFAALTQLGNSEALLNQVAQKVEEIESIEEKQQISSYVQLMAGLKYDKDSIHRIFREDIMRESVIYQDILQQGEIRGEVKGEARAEARAEARRLQEIQRMTIGLLDEGLSIATIARLTELSIEQIQKIQADRG